MKNIEEFLRQGGKITLSHDGQHFTIKWDAVDSIGSNSRDTLEEALATIPSLAKIQEFEDYGKDVGRFLQEGANLPAGWEVAE